MARSLSREQQSILDAILRRGSQIGDPDKRRRYTRAAVETGLVESNLRNLGYGDADSKGWRQERSSLYRNPTNVRASVDRFFREAAQHDRGQSAAKLAADVQRPAAQYRGRYAQVAGQAKALIRGQGGVGGGGGRTPEYLKFDPGDPSAITNALTASTRVPRVAASAPELPSFVKEGLPAPSSPPAIAPTTSLDDVLADIGSQQVSISTAKGGGRRLGGGGGGGIGAPRGKVNVKELFWEGPGAVNLKNNQPTAPVGGHGDHVHVASGPKAVVALGKLAQQMGLHVGENPHFGGVDPVHTANSYHYRPGGQAIDVSGDPRQMRRFAKRVARMRGG